MTSSRPHPPIVIAEIGTAHRGDLSRGLELIDAAADTGADIAKVQVVFADEILPPEAGLVPLPGGDTPLYEVFQKLERPVKFYAALAERAASRNIGFLASPFGEKSIRLLEEIKVGAWKVASPELNHEPLLIRLAQTGLPLILSTGVSKSRDIERALEVITGASLPGNTPQIVILHCLTNYPAPEAEANLKVIPALATAFNLPTGLSDHSLHPVIIPSLAAALGAVMIEKHITLSKKAGGLDDPVALNPEDFSRMTTAVRKFAMAGDKAVDELSREYGQERIEACLGDGIKRLAPSEEAHYRRTNRSLHAIGPLKAGTLLSEENTAILRTEKVLNPGLEPRFRSEAYGRRLIRNIASGDGITLEDIAPKAKKA